MKIYIHVAHDQMYQLLEKRNFDKYCDSPYQVRMVFAKNAFTYFEVYDWMTNYVYKTCISVESLNKFFAEVDDGKGPSHSSE